MLDAVGLSSVANRPARVLSGGEQQKLALARAWALAPEVLFLDEPTANLDPGATREVERIVDQIHASGTKIVMTTHNLGQARRLADEILFMSGGRLADMRQLSAFSHSHRRRKPPRSLKESCPGTENATSASFVAVYLLLAFACAPNALAQRFITVASTTSTEQSGLFEHVLPMFEKKTGIEVRVVALGTGQALDLARRGDADVVFVHAKAAEEKFLPRVTAYSASP